MFVQNGGGAVRWLVLLEDIGPQCGSAILIHVAQIIPGKENKNFLLRGLHTISFQAVCTKERRKPQLFKRKVQIQKFMTGFIHSDKSVFG